jgi:hypothetical protein
MYETNQQEIAMNRLTKVCLAASAWLLCISGQAVAKQKELETCSLDTLKGFYVFSASGHSLIGGVWQPKAIVETIQFHGDGTLTVPAATVANRAGDGAITRSPPGGMGTYVLDEDCKGTLQFTPGPSFDIFVDLKGKELAVIQTNPNNVLQGTVKRLWRGSWRF